MELLEEVDLSNNEITTLDMAFIPQSVKKDRTKLFEWTGVDSKVNSPEFKVQIQRPPTFNRSFISRSDHFGAGSFSDQWLEKLFLKLSLAYNKLTDLSFFASNTQLEELNLIGNQILIFPTLNLPNLRILKMCHNALISMENDPFSQLTSLEQFRISYKSYEYFRCLMYYNQYKLYKMSAWSNSSFQRDSKLSINPQTTLFEIWQYNWGLTWSAPVKFGSTWFIW